MKFITKTTCSILALSFFGTSFFANAHVGSDSANLFYFAAGIGVGWGGPPQDNHSLVGFVPLMVSVGWSWMFNQYVGIRPYLSTDVRADSLLDSNKASAFISGNASLNFDVLGNFYVNDDASLHVGGVLGLGFGFGGGGFLNGGVSVNTSSANGAAGFFSQVHVNVGLKTVWNRKHGIELIARIPAVSWDSGVGGTASINGVTINTTRTYVDGTSLFLTYSRSL